MKNLYVIFYHVSVCCGGFFENKIASIIMLVLSVSSS